MLPLIDARDACALSSVSRRWLLPAKRRRNEVVRVALNAVREWRSSLLKDIDGDEHASRCKAYYVLKGLIDSSGGLRVKPRGYGPVGAMGPQGPVSVCVIRLTKQRLEAMDAHYILFKKLYPELLKIQREEHGMRTLMLMGVYPSDVMNAALTLFPESFSRRVHISC